jgi:hypothetical protein
VCGRIEEETFACSPDSKLLFAQTFIARQSHFDGHFICWLKKLDTPYITIKNGWLRHFRRHVKRASDEPEASHS